MPNKEKPNSPQLKMERMTNNYFLPYWLHPFLLERPLMGELVLPFEGQLSGVKIKVA